MPELTGTLDTSVNGPEGLPSFDGDAWEQVDWRGHEERVRRLRGRIFKAVQEGDWPQTRRCGKAGCRCATGEGHGPYSYFTPRAAGRGRSRYVPSGLVEVVRRCLQRGEAAEAVLAEISAVNAELLARRELR